MAFKRVDPAKLSDEADPKKLLASSALLLIDFQNDYLHPEGALQRLGHASIDPAAREAFVGSARNAANAARAAGRPVIWLKTELLADYSDCGFSPEMERLGLGASNGFLVEGSWGASWIEEMSPASGDRVIVKKGHSPYQFTYLDRLLANLDVSTLVIFGGGVYDGVEEAVRQGNMLGYEIVMAKEGIAFSEMKGHAPSPSSATVVTFEELLEGFRNGAGQKDKETNDSRPTWGLVLVDIQNDFLHPDGWKARMSGRTSMSSENLDNLLRNNQMLIDAAHRSDAPVVFVGTHARDDNLDRAWPKARRRAHNGPTGPVPDGDPYLVTGGWGAKFVSPLDPQKQDFVVMKRGNSGFGLTHLHRLLRNLGVSEIYVTGGGVHGCVEHTIRDGVGLGYSFTLVKDAAYGSLNPPALASHAQFKTTTEVLDELSQAPRIPVPNS